jgi:methylated-DNA-[protein]-cysteine S-methyltransferase
MAAIDAAPVFQSICKVPFGWLEVITCNEAVDRIGMFETRPQKVFTPGSLDKHVCEILQHWFSGGVWPQGIHLNLAGTEFQKKVWRALLQIPVGETRTYGDLAKQLGSAPRAIGGACRRNPVPLLVPCHRVVAANGDGGFAGHTDGFWMDAKRWLLAHE